MSYRVRSSRLTVQLRVAGVESPPDGTHVQAISQCLGERTLCSGHQGQKESETRRATSNAVCHGNEQHTVPFQDTPFRVLCVDAPVAIEIL